MPIFRAPRPVEKVGRDHLQRCATLAEDVSDLQLAIRSASMALKPADMQQAGSSEETVARLLYAVVEAAATGSPPDSVASLIFHASIFTVAMAGQAAEALVSMAGEATADDLNAVLLMALESGQYDFILGGGGHMLALLGEVLGQTYYNALATGFRLGALTKRHRDRSSALADLDAETLLEVQRTQLRGLLPAARREIGEDPDRNRLLDLFEQLAED
jgi:hypothetical protein